MKHKLLYHLTGILFSLATITSCREEMGDGLIRQIKAYECNVGNKQKNYP
jgi:hypothetical protein